MRVIALSTGVLILGCFLLINGLLLLISPASFLRFHDFMNPGQRWNRTAAWRANVSNADWKVLGVMCAIIGLLLSVLGVVKIVSGGH